MATSHPVCQHGRMLGCAGASLIQWGRLRVGALAVSLALSVACSTESPVHSPAADAGDGTGGSTIPTDCSEIEAAYLEQVAVARICNPYWDGYDCDSRRQDSVACGCSISVNGWQTEALAMLNALYHAWYEQACIPSCEPRDCSPTECAPDCWSDPVCTQLSPESGTCTDRCYCKVH